MRQIDLQPHAALEALPNEQQIPTAGGLYHAKVGGSDAELVEALALRVVGDAGEARIDIVVVYKVDRLTRSLADFARLGSSAADRAR